MQDGHRHTGERMSAAIRGQGGSGFWSRVVGTFRLPWRHCSQANEIRWRSASIVMAEDTFDGACHVLHLILPAKYSWEGQGRLIIVL